MVCVSLLGKCQLHKFINSSLINVCVCHLFNYSLKFLFLPGRQNRSAIDMAKFHSLKVSDIKQETSDCVSIGFDIPSDIKSEYKFIQGQYITLKLEVNGEELRRCYSICTSPNDGDLRVAVKRVVDGRASNWINGDLKAGC